MKNYLHIKEVAKREFKRIAERKSLLIISVIFPIVLFLTFSFLYKNEVVRELPVAILDADNSGLSQKLIEFVESSPSMRITDYYTSLSEVKENLIKGIVDAVFYIPRDTEKDVKRGQSSTIVVYKSTSNLIVGNLILKDALTIIKTLSGGILLEKMTKGGISEDEAMKIINPIKLETQSLYNPNYNYQNYLTPGVLTFTLQMIIMITAVLLISVEYNEDTYDELFLLSNKSILNILAGKFFPHFLIHLANAVILIGIIFPLFQIKIVGSVSLIILLFVLFIAASLLLGMMISSFVHNQFLATEIVIVLNTPAFIFSGFTFPLWGMPWIHSAAAQALPFTHFLNGFLKIYQMGTAASYIMNELLILSIFVIIGLAGTLIGLKYNHSRAGNMTSELESLT